MWQILLKTCGWYVCRRGVMAEEQVLKQISQVSLFCSWKSPSNTTSGTFFLASFPHVLLKTTQRAALVLERRGGWGDLGQTLDKYMRTQSAFKMSLPFLFHFYFNNKFYLFPINQNIILPSIMNWIELSSPHIHVEAWTLIPQNLRMWLHLGIGPLKRWY